MKATYKDLYKKSTEVDGKRVISTVFRSLVSGTEDELKAYQNALESQGIPAHRDETTGQLIHFDTVYHGPTFPVIITDTGKIVVPDNKLDFLQSQLKLATDPVVKQALAQSIAQYMVAKITGGASVATVSAPTMNAPTEEASPEEADLDA